MWVAGVVSLLLAMVPIVWGSGIVQISGLRPALLGGFRGRLFMGDEAGWFLWTVCFK